MSTKTKLFLSLAAPGLGKTEELIQKLPELIKKREHIVLALPTIKLSEEIEGRITNKVKEAGLDITPKIFNSEKMTQVINSLEASLNNRIKRFVICTHEAIQQVDPQSLHDWILVFDEVPNVLGLDGFDLDEVEREGLFQYTKIQDKKLTIKEGCKTRIRERVEKSRSGTVDSTLSKVEEKLYTCLLDNSENSFVYVDPTDKRGKQLYRTIEIKDFSRTIKSAKESHLLCANIKGTIFEAFSNIWKLEICQSKLEPKKTTYTNTSRVTIYPLIKGKTRFSAAISKRVKEGEMWVDGGSKYTGGQYIDQMLTRTFPIIGSEDCLLVKNKKVSFDWLNNKEQWKKLPVDTRGLNAFKGHTHCVCLFSCNPVPTKQARSFRELSEITGIGVDEWQTRWGVTNTYEMALQAVTRTNIREDGSTLPITVVVPDMHFVNHLKKTLVDATVDESLAEEIFKPLSPCDGRKTHSKIIDLVYTLESKDFGSCQKIADEIKRVTGETISRQRVSKILDKGS